MPSVDLDHEEWQKVMALLAQAPWNIVNPILMKIGDQLRVQKNSGTPFTVPLKEKEQRK